MEEIGKMRTEKTFDFGKIDYYGKGRKINSVTVEMSYRDGVLSICGHIWNGRHTDIVCGGQCLDEIAEYIHSSKFKKIYRLWKLYHLNDMRPYDEHQKALGWDKQAKEKITIYRWCRDFVKHPKEDSETNPYIIETTKNTLADDIKDMYKLVTSYEECRGHIFFDKHEEGLLCKPCPVCGYEYGSAWKMEEIPDEDVKIIEELMSEGE